MAVKEKLKVVVRKLPPALTDESFKAAVDKAVDSRTYTWYTYFPGKVSLKRVNYSRAYLLFVDADSLFDFKARFDGHIFVSNRGTQYRCCVEYAPFQKVPKQREKRHPLDGTIERDNDYLAFVQQLEAGPQVRPSASQQLEQREAQARIAAATAAAGPAGPAGLAGPAASAARVTPLMEYLQRRYASAPGVRLGTLRRSVLKRKEQEDALVVEKKQAAMEAGTRRLLRPGEGRPGIVARGAGSQASLSSEPASSSAANSKNKRPAVPAKAKALQQQERRHEEELSFSAKLAAKQATDVAQAAIQQALSGPTGRKVNVPVLSIESKLDGAASSPSRSRKQSGRPNKASNKPAESRNTLEPASAAALLVPERAVKGHQPASKVLQHTLCMSTAGPVLSDSGLALSGSDAALDAEHKPTRGRVQKPALAHATAVSTHNASAASSSTTLESPAAHADSSTDGVPQRPANTVSATGRKVRSGFQVYQPRVGARSRAEAGEASAGGNETASATSKTTQSLPPPVAAELPSQSGSSRFPPQPQQTKQVQSKQRSQQPSGSGRSGQQALVKSSISAGASAQAAHGEG